MMHFRMFKPEEFKEQKSIAAQVPEKNIIDLSQEEIDAHATSFIGYWANNFTFNFDINNHFQKELSMLDQLLKKIIQLTSDNWKTDCVIQHMDILNDPLYSLNRNILIHAELIGQAGQFLKENERTELINDLIIQFENKNHNKTDLLIFHLFALRWLAPFASKEQCNRVIQRLSKIFYYRITQNIWTIGLQLGLVSFAKQLDKNEQKQILLQWLNLYSETSLKDHPRLTGQIDCLMTEVISPSQAFIDKEICKIRDAQYFNASNFGIYGDPDQAIVLADLRQFFIDKDTDQFVWRCILSMLEEFKSHQYYIYHHQSIYHDKGSLIIQSLEKITQFISSTENLNKTMHVAIEQLNNFLVDNTRAPQSIIHNMIMVLSRLGAHPNVFKKERDALFDFLCQLPISCENNTFHSTGKLFGLAQVFPKLDQEQKEKVSDIFIAQLTIQNQINIAVEDEIEDEEPVQQRRIPQSHATEAAFASIDIAPLLNWTTQQSILEKLFENFKRSNINIPDSLIFQRAMSTYFFYLPTSDQTNFANVIKKEINLTENVVIRNNLNNFLFELHIEYSLSREREQKREKALRDAAPVTLPDEISTLILRF